MDFETPYHPPAQLALHPPLLKRGNDVLANKSVTEYHSDEYREGIPSASYVTALKYIRSNIQTPH
jgi:hypothetical protein